jgi:hypothetical protein
MTDTDNRTTVIDTDTTASPPSAEIAPRPIPQPPETVNWRRISWNA